MTCSGPVVQPVDTHSPIPLQAYEPDVNREIAAPSDNATLSPTRSTKSHDWRIDAAVTRLVVMTAGGVLGGLAGCALGALIWYAHPDKPAEANVIVGGTAALTGLFGLLAAFLLSMFMEDRIVARAREKCCDR